MFCSVMHMNLECMMCRGVTLKYQVPKWDAFINTTQALYIHIPGTYDAWRTRHSDGTWIAEGLSQASSSGFAPLISLLESKCGCTVVAVSG